MASLPAAHRVFGATELAETIFLEMPAQNIFVNAQRVCRQWKAVIQQSKPLQQALLFQPIPFIQVKPPKGEIRYEHPMGAVWTASDYEPKGWMDIETSAITPAVMHPLTHRSPPYSTCFQLSRCAEDRVQRPDASWRQQLYVQPPTPSVDVYLDWCSEDRTNDIVLVLERNSGILIDQIYKATCGYDIDVYNSDHLEVYKWDIESAADFLERITKRILSYPDQAELEEIQERYDERQR